MDEHPNTPIEDIDFLDPDINDCPYHAYDTLRAEQPAWHDPRTGMFVITRYDDVREVLLDTKTFSSVGFRSRVDPRSAQIRTMYQEHGWVPGPTLASRDDPEHRQLRALFNHAFRPAKIKELDPFIIELADRLVDDFIDAGECEFVRAFAIPLPLIVIGRQMGAPEADIWQIKAWTDAWVQRMGMMQTDDEVIWSTEQEIEAQHYFQPIFERLRAEPDESLLSDLVRTEVPEWGRTLTDNELHAEMMADTFVGGSETTTNALSAGVQKLIENPVAWQQVKDDPETYVPRLVEEVVRLESPVQGLFRSTTRDVDMHGVTIPKGAVVNVRFGAANRDHRQFECPAELDLDRDNGRAHIGFGFGTHHCLGAPLARRELTIGFDTIVRRFERMWLLDGRNDFRHQPNFVLRALRDLHIGFEPSGA